MALDASLLSDFAKVTIYDEKQPVSIETTTFGTVVNYGGKPHVQLDGSDLLTPVTSTVYLKDGDRVTVLIKNHTALVSGNVTDMSIGGSRVKDEIQSQIGDTIAEFEIIIADKVSTLELEAERGRIKDLETDYLKVNATLEANQIVVDELVAKNVEITGTLDAAVAVIDDLTSNMLTAEIADIKYATIENLEATNATIYNLEGTYGEFVELTTQNFEAINGYIQDLDTQKLSAVEADIRYANIDFANIGEAAVRKLFADTGLIKDLVVGDTTITGELVGVTIKGDLIEGNTIVAEKLVVRGSDGLFYKLNTDGMTVGAEQTDYNSLHGSIITAKSITATKISVSDLVAFDATIGGFVIGTDAIHSNVKNSVDNTTRGIYMDNDGQLNVGDSNNYLKYYRDTDGQYKLEISASQMKFKLADGRDMDEAIADADMAYAKSIKSTTVYYVLSTSGTTTPTSGWQTTVPALVNGQYLWTRTVTELQDGTKATAYSISRIAQDGQSGKDGVAGKDGVSVTSTTFGYQLHTSGVNAPTGTWSPSVPNLTKGRYLWTRTTWTYSDSTIEHGYNVSYIPTDGSNGTDGLPGKDGVGISDTVVHYATSSSGTSRPTSGWTTTIPTVSQGKYLWTRTTWTYDDNTSEQGFSVARMGINGQDGSDGIAGKDGVGLSSTSITYQLHTNGNTVPTGTWSSNVPSLVKGRYLWTRTIWAYTDNTTETGYNVSYIATDGNKGDDGIAGKDGVGIKSTTIQYVGSTSGTTKPTSGWTTVIPTVSPGNFLWTKTVWTYDDDTTEEGFSVAKMGDTGATGAQGPQGVKGEKGADGIQRYTWLKYADTPTTGISDNPTGKAYIGLAYNKTTATESSNYGDYTWSLIKGEKGDQGVQGVKGTDGIQRYTWIKYADNASGANMSDSPVGKTHIGLAYNKATATESNTASDYTWSLIKGSDGQSLSSITPQFYLSTSKEFRYEGSWVEDYPTWVPGRYMWTRNKIVYINPAKTEYTTPVLDSSWEAMDGMEFGVRNWLLNSNRDLVNISINVWWSSVLSEVLLEPTNAKSGDYFTFSVYLKVPSNALTGVAARINYYKSNGDYANAAGNIISPGSEGISSVTFKLPNNSFYRIVAGLQRQGADGTGSSFNVQIKNEMLTKGNKATDWIPALEDARVYTAWADNETGSSRFRKTKSKPNLINANNSANGRAVPGRTPVTVSNNSGWGDSYWVRGLTAGQEYTASAYYQSVAGQRVGIRMLWVDDNGSGIGSESNTSSYVNVGSSGWVSITGTVPANRSGLRIQIRYDHSLTTNASVAVRWLKLEEGIERTPWVASPEVDLVDSVARYIGRSGTDSGKYQDYEWTINPEYTNVLAEQSIRDTEDSLNESIENQVDSITETVENKVDNDETYRAMIQLVEALNDAFSSFTDPKEGQALQMLNALEARTLGVINILKEKVAGYDFIDTYMRYGEEGFMIGKQDGNLRMLLTDNRLSFLDGDSEVAYFSNQEFKIERGAIVQSLQVGTHKFSDLRNGHTIVAWTGAENHIKNGSFERDRQFWDGISEINPNGYTGKCSIKRSGHSRYIGYTEPIRVIPGARYYISYYIQTSANANGTTENQKFRIGDAITGAYVSALGVTGARTAWTKIEGYWTCPSNISLVIVSMNNNHTASGSWVKYDDIVFKMDL